MFSYIVLYFLGKITSGSSNYQTFLADFRVLLFSFRSQYFGFICKYAMFVPLHGCGLVVLIIVKL